MWWRSSGVTTALACTSRSVCLSGSRVASCQPTAPTAVPTRRATPTSGSMRAPRATATTMTAITPKVRRNASASDFTGTRMVGRSLERLDLACELAQERDRVLAAEQPLHELAPAQRRAHLDAQPHLVAGRIPGQMARARRHDDRLARPGGVLLAGDAERRGPRLDHVALLHLGMHVLGRALPGPRPDDLHGQQLGRVDHEGDALAGVGADDGQRGPLAGERSTPARLRVSTSSWASRSTSSSTLSERSLSHSTIAPSVKPCQPRRAMRSRAPGSSTSSAPAIRRIERQRAASTSASTSGSAPLPPPTSARNATV